MVANNDKRHAAVIDSRSIPNAIALVDKRRAELVSLLHSQIDESSGPAILEAQKNKINDTFSRIFGLHSQEYYTYGCGTLDPHQLTMVPHERTIAFRLPNIIKAIRSEIINLDTVKDLLQERVSDLLGDDGGRTLRAYEGLSLHPEIERASSQLFRDGHHSNAVEAAVKALNALVRLRSGLELDGTSLMEKTFSPKSPVLRFNKLSDISEQDEQKGFMYLFSGAVSGLRNPRAHGFVIDDPERALEFIAFVSLLAKLLDGASK